MNKNRKIFFVVASGGHDTERHYHDTIERKRTVNEIASFLHSGEIKKLKRLTHDRPFAVWGAVPGSGNIRTWTTMEAGDYVLIYRAKKIILVAEIAMKVKNPNLANFFWKKDKSGKTWEYIYFLINQRKVNIDQSTLNSYLGYKKIYFPRGFTGIDQKKVNKLLASYGDLFSLLQKLETGQKVEKIDTDTIKQYKEIVDEKIIKAPTEHDEMQWRLIRLGNKAKLDVWVPKNDQNRKYNGNTFKDFVIPEFQQAIDIPTTIKNIDTVWKLGYSVKAAFEIEHSTSIYSGILRLSDLKSLAPNSNYPLFIVANRSKKSKVFNQLKRPTFSNEYLHLDKAIKFLSYKNIRELDEQTKKDSFDFQSDWISQKAESVN